MDKAKIFMNGKSQAVRLPKKYRFDTDEVLISEHPSGLLLIDPKRRWDDLEKIVEGFTEDFKNMEREPGNWTEREDL